MGELKIHKCKNCGEVLDYSKAVDGVLRCESCYTVYTVPRNNSKASSQLDMGMHELDTCNFDAAYTAFQKAAEIDKKEPEAYFGMALANARVQYLKDYQVKDEQSNGRMQPIVHEVTEKSFAQDANYKKALELATPEQKKTYTSKAKEIDYIRSKFYEFKKDGVKFDCFICSKVKKEDGTSHTEDHNMATRLYHDLRDEGFRPFYSEEEIKGRTGTDYEALILYALHSAQSMLLVCTDESYLQTPWVKNEYTRYLNMLNQEDKQRGSITIVFKDNVIEKLPGINGKIQGVPFNSHDALKRITEFVGKFAKSSAPELTRKEYGNVTYQKKNVVKQGVTKRQLNEVEQEEITVSEEKKLEIIKNLLEKSNYKSAIRRCKNLIFDNPSNSEAYWLLFLAENECANANQLFESCKVIFDFTNFEKALASAPDDECKGFLNSFLFDKVKKDRFLPEYQEYIVLPDSSEKDISIVTDLMFERALKEKDEEIFNVIIKTISDTDKYISMNMEFSKVVDKENVAKYCQNVLAVDEGNLMALWQVFMSEHNFNKNEIFEFCSDAKNHPTVEDKLFSYSYNEIALKNLINICFKRVDKDAEKCCDMFDFLLSLVPHDKNEFYLENLNRFIELLFKENKFELIARFNEKLIAMDKYNHNAYFTRCLINHELRNPLGFLTYADDISSDEDYSLAIDAYAEKFPDKKNNVYIDFSEELKKLYKDVSKYKECMDFLIEKHQISIDDFEECGLSKLYTALYDEAENIVYATLEKYGSEINYKGKIRGWERDLPNVYELRVDVSQDPNLTKAYNFAVVAKCDDLAKKIKEVIDTQAQRCSENVAKDQKEHIKEVAVKHLGRFYVSTWVFSIVCAISLIVTLLLAMVRFAGFVDFWLLIFNGSNAALYLVGLLLVFVMLMIVIAMIRSKKGEEFNDERGILPIRIIKKILNFIIDWMDDEFTWADLVSAFAMVIIIVVTVSCYSVGISKLGSANKDDIESYNEFNNNIVISATYDEPNTSTVEWENYFGIENCPIVCRFDEV